MLRFAGKWSCGHSCLSEGEVEVIVGNIREIWHLSDDTECTIEVNPEDVTPDKLACWKNVGFNRLSIGVQSFDDEVLKRINRRHSNGGSRSRPEGWF